MVEVGDEVATVASWRRSRRQDLSVGLNPGSGIVLAIASILRASMLTHRFVGDTAYRCWVFGVWGVPRRAFAMGIGPTV